MIIEKGYIKFEGDDHYFTDMLIGQIGVEKFHIVCTNAIELKKEVEELISDHVETN